MNEVPVKKNEHYEMSIQDIGNKGEGIGKVNDFTVFVEGGLPGDVIEVRIVKVKKSFAFGKLINILQPSSVRVQPSCDIASKCGGCQLQHLSYEAQLRWKTKKVKDTIERIGKIEGIEVNDTIGMKTPKMYRNKAQFPVQKNNGELEIGFYAGRSHRVIDIDECEIQHPINTEILKRVRDFLETYPISIYDERKHKGLVRHIVTKVGFQTGEIMVCIVINGKKLPYSEQLIDSLMEIEGMTSIVLSHHTDKSNVILGKKITTLWGQSYITDLIGDIKFEISPLSFFQVNPVQTKVLYEKALEFAELTGTETVWDAYCGIGSISLFLAQKAKQVYGVEIVGAAIEDANKNAELNGITNTTFFVGRAEEIIPEKYEKDGIKVDVMVVDPPRKGCDEKLLQTIVKMAPEKVVYVSCDPGTLARDLNYLMNNGFEVKKVQPVDMFPNTSHVECCVLLKKAEK